MGDIGPRQVAALAAVMAAKGVEGLTATEHVMAHLDAAVFLTMELGGDPVALAASMLVRESGQDADKAETALRDALARVHGGPKRAAPLDAEGLLRRVEEELRAAAESFPEDEAAAIETAGGVALDAVRAEIHEAKRASEDEAAAKDFEEMRSKLGFK